FFGIARLGVARSSRWAALASIGAALCAFLASRRPPAKLEHAEEPTSGPRAALAIAFVSGFVMLGCELLWARVLTFVFGHDAYAFASLLVMVLFGLALGGFLHRAFAHRDQERLLSWTLGAFALSVLLSYWGATALVVKRGRDPFAIASGELSVSVWIEMVRALAYAPLLVLLPALLSGLIFPAACALYRRKVGVVFLANGIGSALGAVVAAMALVQTLGIQGAFIALAIVSSATVLVLRKTRVIPLAATIAVALIMPRALPKQMLLQAFGNAHQQLVHYEEGRTGTVSVIVNDINGEKELLMNGINEVTTRLVHDQSFKILGHLGPLLHPHPKSAVMICLGAGLSAGATLRHPIERLDIVDLSSIVANGARKFAVENNHALDDPRLHLHIADGRQFLLNSPGGYDVAVIDSTHPKAVDSWILYTKEFYDLVRARLAEGGIVVQWLPLHGLSEREFKIIVRTFASAFPDMTLWANAGFETYGPVGYAKLVGAKGPLVIDPKALAERLKDPKIHADLEPFGMATAPEILNLFVARADAVRAWTEGLPLQTDDDPMVPYTTTWTPGRKMEPSFFLAIRNKPLEWSGAELDAAWEGQGLVLSGQLARAAELHPDSPTIRLFVAQSQTTKPYYEAFAARYPRDTEKLFEAANQLGGAGEWTSAQTVYERALSVHPHDFRLRLNLALLLQNAGDLKSALKLLSTLRDEQPTSATVLYNLGAALLANGDAAAARVQLDLALGWDPSLTRARLALAVALLQLGEIDRADAALRAVMQENPWIAEAHDLAGLVEARRGHPELAIAHVRKAISLQPYRASFHFDLASLLAGEAAEAEYRATLRLEPRHLAALDNLGVLLSARGDHEGAAELFLQALDVAPRFALAAHHLGLARRAQGRSAEAKNAFCTAFELGFEPSREGCKQ
ncbi:MAG: fused MFS/spermidine synthase, partial [Polyangiales bacterium]